MKLHLERLKLLDERIEQLSQMSATALNRHRDAVAPLAVVPGSGVNSAQQKIAEVGVDGGSRRVIFRGGVAGP
jgi:hypothetical protein